MIPKVTFYPGQPALPYKDSSLEHPWGTVSSSGGGDGGRDGGLSKSKYFSVTLDPVGVSFSVQLSFSPPEQLLSDPSRIESFPSVVFPSVVFPSSSQDSQLWLPQEVEGDGVGDAMSQRHFFVGSSVCVSGEGGVRHRRWPIGEPVGVICNHGWFKHSWALNRSLCGKIKKIPSYICVVLFVFLHKNI